MKCGGKTNPSRWAYLEPTVGLLENLKTNKAFVLHKSLVQIGSVRIWFGVRLKDNPKVTLPKVKRPACADLLTW